MLEPMYADTRIRFALLCFQSQFPSAGEWAEEQFGWSHFRFRVARSHFFRKSIVRIPHCKLEYDRHRTRSDQSIFL